MLTEILAVGYISFISRTRTCPAKDVLMFTSMTYKENTPLSI